MSDIASTATSQLAAQEINKRAVDPSALAPPAASPFTALSSLTSAPANAVQASLQFATQTPSVPAFDPNYQRNLQTLTNKYTEMAPGISALPEQIRNALISYDSARVAKGSTPLTRDQTLKAVQTALTNTPATAPPERNVTNVFGNFRSDLSDVLKALPRMPVGLVHEVTDLPHITERISEAQQAGKNPIAALLAAPGVRMIPGAYIAGSVAQGPQGIKDLLSHPLMAGLDALPFAHYAAAGTEVAKVAEAGAELAGKRPRPITAVLTGKVLRDDAGNLVRAEMTPTGVEGLGRNALGNHLDVFRNETKVGEALDAFGGKRSRDVSRIRGWLEQRFHAAFHGALDPQIPAERLAAESARIFDDYADKYPFLAKDAKASPELQAQRAEFWNTLQRNPDALDPGLVGRYRELQYDFAKALEADGKLGIFDNEWYDAPTARKLRAAENRLQHHQQMFGMANHYLNPSEGMTYEQLRSMADAVAQQPSRIYRGHAARALEQTLDAYGLDTSSLSSARARLVAGKGSPDEWQRAVTDLLDGAEGHGIALTPRRSMDQIIETLRQYDYRRDPQAARLQDAVRAGDRNLTTKILKNLYDRKPPAFPDDLYAGFRDDVRSMSRRVDFHNKIGKAYSESRLEQRMGNFEKLRNESAPARFHALLGDEVKARGTAELTATAERNLGRRLTPEEAGQLTSALIERRWADLPGIDPATAAGNIKQIEREVTATWRELRDAGADPVFVHKVSPGRANQALAGNINPIPVNPSQGKERVLDLSPSVQDIHVSVRHQAAELLQQQYNEQFIHEVMDLVGRREGDLRSELADTVRWHMQRDPSLDFEGHLQQIIRRQYEKFNPQEAGTSWGGVRLEKYAGTGADAYYIPKSIASNLHSYAKPPSLFTSMIDPITSAFRYTVLGLSPSVVVNNFFGNSAAVIAESGLSPFKYWSTAREWTMNPMMIPNEELRAMFLAEIPNMESVSRDAWLASRTGEKFMAGFNAGQAFKDSVVHNAMRSGKAGLDAVATRLLDLQRTGDNVYRAMQYMDELNKGLGKGKSVVEAENAALELVRRTLIDYRSFTPIERSAMRTIIPFYSYLSHAARFIMRYPFDHPLRASIMADIAAAERERLGALPGTSLSMLPIPSWLPGGGEDSKGKQNAISLRPWDSFGDISDLMSVAGWMSAMNPVVQTALEQIGVVRGEAELFPTMRYDPETGRMKAVHGSFLMDLLNNTVPRAGLLTAALGVNSQYNQIAQGDPDAAKRYLVSMAGLPRVWRNTSPFQDMFKAEVARQNSQNDVKLTAMKTGNWTEAMRYPGLRQLPSAINQLPANVLAQYQAQSPDDIAQTINGILSGKG